MAERTACDAGRLLRSKPGAWIRPTAGLFHSQFLCCCLVSYQHFFKIGGVTFFQKSRSLSPLERSRNTACDSHKCGTCPPSHGWPTPRPGLRPIRAPLALSCSSRPGPPGSLGFPASLCWGPGPQARLQGDGAEDRRHGVRSPESETPPLPPSTAKTWPSLGIMFFFPSVFVFTLK